jgi:ABC-type cobalt transport system substrate-binding protein
MLLPEKPNRHRKEPGMDADDAAVHRAVELVYHEADANEQYVGADDSADEHFRNLLETARMLKWYADIYHPQS